MITSAKVHLIIQQMNNNLSVPGTNITVDSIVQKLDLDISELMWHLNTLNNMSYIHFTNNKNNDIRLTYSGKYSVIPQLD